MDDKLLHYKFLGNKLEVFGKNSQQIS